MNYPEPNLNPKCQCRDNPAKAFWCRFGHMTECHFPYDCKTAGCGHLFKYDFTPDEVSGIEGLAKEAMTRGLLPPYKLDPKGNVTIEIKPDKVFKTDEPPTINKLIDQLLAAGRRSGALVRPAQAGRKTGVCVFMLGNKAIRNLGPYLRAYTTALKQTPNYAIEAAVNASAATVMEVMEERGVEWMWMEIMGQNEKGMAVFIVSDKLDDTFAGELTKRGCICNFK
jgi:hypothetical protein